MPIRHLRVPGEPRLRLGVAEQRVDLCDGGLFVAGRRPDVAEPLPQAVYRLQLCAVVIAPAGPAEAVQIGVQRFEVGELLTVDPVGVDEHTRRPQGQLSVISENHLTHDLLSG